MATIHRSEPEPLIPKHGGYRKLKSFQLAQLIYDVTVRFCNRYIDRRSRTHDQMVQTARSGVQNIAEGSQASGTSKKMELKLTNVARASLEELRLDYEDFLRQRGFEVWPVGDPRRAALIARRPATVEDVSAWVQAVKARSGQSGRDGRSGPGRLSTASTSSTPSSYPDIAANAALTIIAVTCSLLDRQLAAQAAAFEQEGGFTASGLPEKGSSEKGETFKLGFPSFIKGEFQRDEDEHEDDASMPGSNSLHGLVQLL